MALTRAENMARITATDTKPELMLRKALWQQGMRYRIHFAVENIRPDIVFARDRVAVFIDGCQWHGCPTHYVFPRTNREFWAEKLRKNVERDVRQTQVLRSVGWKPYRVWEHKIWTDLSTTVEAIKSLVLHGIEPSETNWRLIKVDILDEPLDIEERLLISLESPSVTVTEQKNRSTQKWKRTKPSSASPR